MPCVEISPPVLPPIPAPFSITPPSVTFPPIAVGVNVCCITKTFARPPIPLPPIPFPSTALFNAFIIALNAAEATIQTYLDEYLVVSIACPRS